MRREPSSGQQLISVLKTSLLIDMRAGASLPGKFSRSRWAFFWMLFFYFLMGTIVGLSFLVTGLPIQTLAAILFCSMFVFVSLNILIEYQEILMSPADGEILFWRPISSRTIFLAKLFNLMFYVGILTLAMSAVPTVLAVVRSEERALGVGIGFLLGAMMNAYAATAVTILLYGFLLRFVSPERLQDFLAYVQLAFSMIVFLGYQVLRPLLERIALGELGDLSFLRLLPPGWYAAWPGFAEGGFSGEGALLAVVGIGFLFCVGWVAARRLAPIYQDRIASVVGSTAPGKPRRRAGDSTPLRIFAGLFARDPLRRAGLDFFLANLRGDRKIKVNLLPVVALPVVFAGYGWFSEGVVDPYRVEKDGGPTFLSFIEIEPESGAELESGPEAVGASSEKNGEEPSEFSSRARRRARRSGSSSFLWCYVSVYMLAMFCLTLARTVSVSSSFRAAWVFYAAPQRRFERFYAGCLLGMIYGLLLPAALLLVGVFLLAWKNPVHVGLHLIVPIATGYVLLPIGLLFGKIAPPFSREPARGGRSLDVLMGFLGVPLLFGIGAAHFFTRHHPLQLLGVAVLLFLLGSFFWLLARMRFRDGLGESLV